MRCEQCGAELVSRDGDRMTTLVGYSSPEGHDHDENCVGETYRCAAGHPNVLRSWIRCPVDGCEWVACRPPKCSICRGRFVDALPDLPVGRRTP